MFTTGSPNFFVRGPLKLLHNSARAERHPQCDCFGICCILPNQQLFRKYVSFHFLHNVFAARFNGFAGRMEGLRSLEAPG